MLDPRDDRVRPYCVTFLLEKTKLHVASAESYLKDICRFVVVERHNAASLSIHVHTDHPGVVLESVIGWGHLAHVEIRDMAEPHALSHVHAALMPVAVLAVAEDDEAAAMLQENGAAILVKGSAADCPSVGELINAAHSDMAASYVMLANDESMYLVMNQAKYILGDRLELVIAGKPDSQRRAMQVFDAKASAKENAAKMRAAVEASD
jgi:dihydroxyacetone kinase-like predicted kinase